MISSDPRCFPLLELSQTHIRTLLQPVFGNAAPQEIVLMEEGLVNTTYRITIDGQLYGLRVYASNHPAMEMECQLLQSLSGRLPIQRVLFADASGQRCEHPYLVYQWLAGISLNEYRRQSSKETLLELAKPLGRLLAQIATASLPVNSVRKKIQVIAQHEQAKGQLRSGLVRERLGGALADRFSDCLSERASTLRGLDQTTHLIHGDFGGRNILVKPSGNDAWIISGVIDWENAAWGSALWDVGSLFRYPRRYTEEFRTLFVQGYCAGGGHLPSDWWLIARTIDALRLIEILSEERELPAVFAECAELIASIITESHHVAA